MAVLTRVAGPLLAKVSASERNKPHKSEMQWSMEHEVQVG